MHYAFNMKICLHSHSVYHVCAECIVVVVAAATAAAAVVFVVVVVVIAVTTCYVVKHFFRVFGMCNVKVVALGRMHI